MNLFLSASYNLTKSRTTGTQIASKESPGSVRAVAEEPPLQEALHFHLHWQFLFHISWSSRPGYQTSLVLSSLHVGQHAPHE